MTTQTNDERTDESLAHAVFGELAEALEHELDDALSADIARHDELNEARPACQPPA